MRRFVLLALAVVLVLSTATAGPITFSGHFQQDEDVVLIPFALATSTLVTMRTTSFADGSHGFEPVLTLYDGSGDLLLQDATGGTVPGGCGLRAVDGLSGYCLDAVIQSPLNPGSYTLALTEWDNIPSGSTLADGFPETGNGNFTGPKFLGAPGSFIMFDKTQRSSYWALQIDGTQVPEPAVGMLSATGLLLVALFHRRRRR